MYVKNIKEIKASLRAKYRQYRERLSPEQKSAFDQAILSRLAALKEYAKADTVFTYVSKSIEVDTFALIAAAFSAGKRVAVPRCVPGTYDMEFYFIRSLEDLAAGSFGVLEPVPAKCALVPKDAVGLCVVPGLSFDTQGYRLGYGKGYYDRFLAEFQGNTVGICYSGCIQWNLPHGYYDKPVDLLITEKYIRRMANQKKHDR